jgi:hypothetical protein
MNYVSKMEFVQNQGQLQELYKGGLPESAAKKYLAVSTDTT